MFLLFVINPNGCVSVLSFDSRFDRAIAIIRRANDREARLQVRD